MRSTSLSLLVLAGTAVAAACDGTKAHEARDSIAPSENLSGGPVAHGSAAPPDVSASESSAEGTAKPSASVVARSSESASSKPAKGSDKAAALSAGSVSSSSDGDLPGDRIYAKGRHVWILPGPRPTQGWLGYITLGGSVRLFEGSAAKAKTIGPGCPAWYRVEPMGYVCAGDDATIDANDPAYVALHADAADVSAPYPYGYAESLGAPRYDKVPTEEQQRRAEWQFDQHQEKLSDLKKATLTGDLSKVDKSYVGVDFAPAGVAAPELFPFGGLVREPRDYVAPGSTVAFSRAFDQAGRTWLITSDHAIVPKDWTRPFPKTAFTGVRLENGVSLPIAFARRHDAPLYKETAPGTFVATDQTLPRLAWVMLTDKSETAKGEIYRETKQGSFVRVSDTAIAEAAKETPYVDTEKVDGRRTWLDVSVLGGTLVAYEASTPIFVTLIAPGRGGIPFPGRDPLTTASTPVGTFRVDGKFKAATMVSSTDDNIVHSEVPWVQNFHGPHALHGAYWHDAWGELKSGGCVNLSPIDAKLVFEWSEPSVPRDWYGIRSAPEMGAATRVVVRR